VGDGARRERVYGSWIFNNGWVNPLRGHGHGFYMQNSQTSEEINRKLIRDNIVWNSFGWGVHARGGCGQVQGFTVEGTISFNNGAPKNVYFAQDPILYADSQKSNYPNFFFEAAAQMRDIVMRGNYGWAPVGVGQFAQSIRVGSENHFHSDIVIEDNYIVGDGPPLYLENWTLAKVTGNTFVGGLDNNVGNATEDILVYIDERTTAHLPTYIWDDNHWFNSGTSPTPFKIWYRFWGPTHRVSFNDWKTMSGLDASSTYSASLPTMNVVAVLPNAYEAGRAHVAIYNWEGLSSVPVDLSTIGLTNGQAFKIYNVQSFKLADVPDYYGNVAVAGTYNSGSPVVSVPMTDTTETQPIGFPVAVPSSMPHFGVFLVLGGV
jgi:hypothetical protein